MTDALYDLVVLGGGSAAFAAIAEANRHHKTTALVNTGLPLGGTCVNVGCIPSKHLLAVAEAATVFQRHSFQGITYDMESPAIDWTAIREEKDIVVQRLREQNYTNVADHYDTDIYTGHGRLINESTVELTTGEDAGRTVAGKILLIATGSSPRSVLIDGLDAVPYETSETILDRDTLPGSITMIGGGFVAMEWGQILHRLGVDVTILQRSRHVLSRLEGQLGRALEQYLTGEGIRIMTNAQVQTMQASNGRVQVRLQQDTKTTSLRSDAIMLAVGVSPNTDNLGLENVGIALMKSGAIQVNEYYQTSVPHIYAAGDVIGRPMLETAAAREGNIAMQNAFANARKTINYRHIPQVVFTDPEVASVGITEGEYIEKPVV